MGGERSKHEFRGAGAPGAGVFARLAALSVVLVVFSVAATSFLVQRSASSHLHRYEVDNLGFEAQVEGGRLVAIISAMRDDARTLASTPPIRGMVESALGGEKNSVSGENYEVWRQRLDSIFRSFASTKHDYLQIRFVGVADGGREIVRVDRYGDAIVSIPGGKLQQKAETDYFKNIMLLRPGEVYVSEINLNREHGKVVEPHVKVIRIGVPVHDHELNVFGFVIINADIGAIFDRIRVREGVHAYVANHEGDYLLHPNSNLEFGFDLSDDRHRILDEFPATQKFYQEGFHDRHLTVELGEGKEASIFRLVKVALDPRDRSRFITLGLRTSNSLIRAQADAAWNHSFITTLIVLVVGSGIGLWMARTITRPIVEMTQAGLRIARGDEQASLPVERGDEIGDLARAFDTMMDQVQQRGSALDASQQRMHAIVDSAADGIMVIDQVGRVESCNVAAEKMFGFRREAMEGVPIVHLIRDFPSEELQIDSERRYRGVLRDGGEVPLSITSGQFHAPDGHPRRTLVIRNTTEIDEARAKIEGALQEAQSAAQARTQFLANMSHEIRTPLNGVLGTAEILLESELAEDQRGLTETILDSGRTLLSIVNDVLDLSKVDSGKMRIELVETDVRVLSRMVANAIEPLVRPGVEFSSMVSDDVPEWLRLDPVKVRQILSNLLGNAAKFTSSGVVELRVSMAEIQSGRQILELRIRDTGIGIEENRQKEVFDMFKQADASTTRRHGGTGLGLALVREFVRLLGGEISLESRIGHGSTFTVRLPVQVCAAPQHVEGPVLGQSGAELRQLLDSTQADAMDKLAVLVAEDHKTNQVVIRRLLESLVGSVDIVENGQALVDELHANPQKYDVLLIDHHMPVLDGLGAIRKIRESGEGYKDIYAISLTASTLQDERSRSLEAGMNDFLTKPVDRGSLHAALEQSLRGTDVSAVAKADDRPSEEEEAPAVEPAKAEVEPVEAERKPPKVTVSGRKQVLKGLKVLVVDDDVTNLDIAHHRLRRAGAEVEVMRDGAGALELMKTHSFDLLLVDSRMPVMDGPELARTVRANGYTGILLAYTGFDREFEAEKWASAEINGFADKMLNVDELAGYVEKSGQAA